MASQNSNKSNRVFTYSVWKNILHSYAKINGYLYNEWILIGLFQNTLNSIFDFFLISEMFQRNCLQLRKLELKMLFLNPNLSPRGHHFPISIEFIIQASFIEAMIMHLICPLSCLVTIKLSNVDEISILNFNI